MSASLKLVPLLLLISSALGAGPKINNTRTCYSSVGCFSNFPPWTNPSRPSLPPRHPLNVSDTMKMYNRNNPEGISFSTYPELDLDVIYNNRSIFFIFHGHRGNSSESWISSLAHEILNDVDGVVFVPEYNLASLSFEQALGDVRVVAKLSALVIEAIEADIRLVHLIGHGIGAHSASYVANMFQSGKNLGRITGLDPTRFYYEGQHNDILLDKTDAISIDIWHTSAGGIGIINPSGHVDYYINGGQAQPACKLQSSPDECNHQIILDIYIEAVKGGCLVGDKAELKVDGQTFQSIISTNQSEAPLIGLQTNVPPGVYLVITNEMPPFCTDADDNSKMAFF